MSDIVTPPANQQPPPVAPVAPQMPAPAPAAAPTPPPAPVATKVNTTAVNSMATLLRSKAPEELAERITSFAKSYGEESAKALQAKLGVTISSETPPPPPAPTEPPLPQSKEPAAPPPSPVEDGSFDIPGFEPVVPPIEVKAETVDELIPHLKAAGFEINSKAEVGKVLADIRQLRTISDSAKETEENLAQWNAFYSSLPTEMRKLMEEFRDNGIDGFQRTLQQVSQSITAAPVRRPAEQMSKLELIRAYYPGKLTEEQLAAGGETVEAYYEAAKAQHQTRIREWNTAEQTRKTLEAETERQWNASVAKALSVVEAERFSPTTKGQVKDIVSKGDEGIRDLFFDKKGMFRPDAAKRIYVALHADQIIETLKSVRASKHTSHQARVESANGAPNPPVAAPGGGVTPVQMPKAKPGGAKQTPWAMPRVKPQQ